MTDLVSLPDLQVQLQQLAETKVDVNDAYAILRQTQLTYEADRVAKDTTIAQKDTMITELDSECENLTTEVVMLTAQRDTLTSTVNNLTAQMDTLTQGNTDKTAEIVRDNALIATLTNDKAALTSTVNTLNLQVHDLSPDVTVTIGSAPIMTSRLAMGLSNVDNKDLLYANATAKANGMANLAPCFDLHHKPIMAWGSGDLWPWDGIVPKPAAPTNWTSLDTFLQMGLDMGLKNAISTQIYPWHMKGIWNADGSTTPCTAADAFNDEGVVMTSQMLNYRLLIRTAAQRYLGNPYNVRIWVTGVEFHGAFRGRNKTFDEFRWDDYPGTSGNNADCGMAYLHNVVVEEILAVAATKGIDPATLIFISNYPPITSDGKPNSNSVPIGHPLYARPWGTARRQPLSVLKNMIPLLKRVDAVGFDMRTTNKDGVHPLGDFEALSRYDDFFGHMKTLVPGKSLVCMETYDAPVSDTGSPQYRAAIRAEAFRKMLLNGITGVYVWGTSGAGMGPAPDYGKRTDAGLLTDTSVATGGQPKPMLDVVRLYHDHFGPGTPIYDAIVSGSGVSVLPSDQIVFLLNKTGVPHKVALGNDVYRLDPYQLRAIPR